ncbi:CobW family GTP-binding protein [Vibrio agarilyticus]|nr:GTP-binding protein [Vibrio agarilyticus]
MAIPTHIITGFLGVGKTTAILNFIATKPANERWAVLVNEFGEVGVDRALMQGQTSPQQKPRIAIREVPGGCMCCSAGLPMQIALNQLLKEVKPHRLLIEPTGLGHPKEVLQMLSNPHYRKILSLQKTVTLVDARQLFDPRYINHETFNQQIAIADLVVGNKHDSYQERDCQALKTYVKKIGRANAKVIFATHGVIAPDEFDGLTEAYLKLEKSPHVPHVPHAPHAYRSSKTTSVSERALPQTGRLKAVNQGEGFQSAGWRFSPNHRFDRQKVISFLVNLDVERVKAVFITEDGIFGYNQTADGLTEIELDECVESRIEFIAKVIDAKIETQLLALLSAQ